MQVLKEELKALQVHAEVVLDAHCMITVRVGEDGREGEAIDSGKHGSYQSLGTKSQRRSRETQRGQCILPEDVGRTKEG